MAAVVRLVRPLLHSYGLRLPNRVRVELTALADLQNGSFRRIHGRTVTRRSPIDAAVLEIRIATGLPTTQFGQVLAHEMGHAWLAGCPDPDRRSERTEEGICELLGSWWLRHRGGRLAAHLLDAMAASPDPIYGEGYRKALRATRGVTPPEIVAQIRLTGRITPR